MDLLPNEEQEHIIDAITSFLEKESPAQRLIDKKADEPLTSRAMWQQYGDLGWIGMGISEHDGGVGFTLVEELLMFREVGRYLLSPSILSTVLAARLAISAGKTEIARDLLSGKSVACWATPSIDAQVGDSVNGVFQLFEGAEADYAFVLSDNKATLLNIADFSDTQPIACMDETIMLSKVKARKIRPAIVSREQYTPLSREATLMIAAILSGMASAACNDGVEYAKLREQFGKPIGTFQAIKHMCSDMAVRAEAAIAQSTYAVISAQSGHDDAAFQIASAGVLASEAAHKNSAENLQIHGGIGYTAEHTPHLYVKRAHVMDHIAGGQRLRLRQALEASVPT